MQIGLFEIVNGVPVPNDAVDVIPWLKKIKEDFPKDYLKVYAYLFYMSCWDGRNIYINKPEEDREQAILEDLEIMFSLEHPTITYALDRCKELYTTPKVDSFRSAKKMIHAVNKYLETTTPVSGGKNSNVADINTFMKMLLEYNATYDKLEEQLKDEQHKVRGNKAIAYDQKYMLEGDNIKR